MKIWIPSLPVGPYRGAAPDPAQPLHPVRPEIAFVGRSNVGKSSLLNALVGSKGLARVSGTPGKTQHLNVYGLPWCYLVDLPGYGWARAAKRDREGYRALVDTYIRHRGTLRGVVWLLDVRHPPSTEDRRMQDLLMETQRSVLTVLTKVDKLSQAQRHAAIRQRLRRPATRGSPPSAQTAPPRSMTNRASGTAQG